MPARSRRVRTRRVRLGLRLERNTTLLSTALDDARKVARKRRPQPLNLLRGQELRVSRASLQHLVGNTRKEASGCLDAAWVGDVEAGDENGGFALGVESSVGLSNIAR